MFERLKDLLGFPNTQNVLDSVSIRESNQIARLIADAVQDQLMLANRPTPADWSRSARATVLGYVAAAGTALTAGRGGSRALLISVVSSKYLLRDTFDVGRTLEELEHLASSRNTDYLAGAKAGYRDARRLRERRPMRGLIPILH